MKRKSITTRVCALCSSIIPDEHVVCKKHFSDYILYKNESWMIALVDAQRRQFQIDNEELYLQSGVVFNDKKPYRKFTKSEKWWIDFYRSKGLGSRTIAKILDLNWCSIQSYLDRKAGKKKRRT